MRLSPTEAPWQNSLAERHGSVFGEIFRMMVEEFSLEGELDIDLACQAATLAKNRRCDSSGFSPRMRVSARQKQCQVRS